MIIITVVDYAGNLMISQVSLFPTAIDGEVLLKGFLGYYYLPGKICLDPPRSDLSFNFWVTKP